MIARRQFAGAKAVEIAEGRWSVGGRLLRKRVPKSERRPAVSTATVAAAVVVVVVVAA